MFGAKRLLAVIQILIVGLGAVFAVQGASGDVDTGFDAFVARTNGSNLQNLSIKTSVVQPDGKILIAGTFTEVGKYARTGIARLNANGTIDATFNPPEILSTVSLSTNVRTYSAIYGLGLQADGKIFIAGDFNYVNGELIPRLARLNPDGSPDTAFNTSLHQQLTQFDGIIYDIKILPNNQILLGGDFSFLTPSDGRIVRPIAKINPDGSFDNSFNSSSVGMTLRKFEVLPDGRILVAGTGLLSFNNVGFARLNNNGSIDFSFTGVHVGGTVNDFEVLNNGQYLIVGDFNDINGFTQGRISRINSDGSLDLNFNGGNNAANSTIYAIDIQPDGKILIGGLFNTYNAVAKNKLARLNNDGSIDNSFNYNQMNDGIINAINILPNGNIFIGGETGTWDRNVILDSGGTSQPPTNLVGMNGLVKTIVQQPDGKIIVGGRFEWAGGAKRSNIARFNLDGTLDSSFNPTGLSVNVFILNKILLQPDGKILLATMFGDNFRRLNPDGSIDTGFNFLFFGSRLMSDIALLPDGKIIAVGTMRPPDTFNDREIIRVNSNGVLDTSFTSVTTNGFINKVLVQPDGKILIAGTFTQVAGANRGRIARLNADGTLDNTFVPLGGANNTIQDMALQPDGKILVGGDFDGLNGSVSTKYIGRLNSDGSLDTNFNQVANSTIDAVSLQSDGKILIGGAMTLVGGVSRSGIARLNSNGTLDTGFQPGNGTNGPVWSIVTESDGKILVGGEFSKYNGFQKASLVRLSNSAATRSLFDFDGDGRADIAVFRPSTNRWYEFLSGNSSVFETTFGSSGDVVAPADYDGDGKTDIAIFRPGSGDWWYLSSFTNVQTFVHWGASGDLPRPSDFDSDGKADFIVYRPSNSVWYRFGSSGVTSITAFGISEDKPLIGDFDGDGKSDLAIYRPSSGDWWWQSSLDNSQRATHWGLSTDIPAPADYDGDGKTDFAVYRPSNGTWYIFNSSDLSYTIINFGLAEDKPTPADYDGDGKADIAVFRPSTGVWYLQRSTQGFSAVQFGLSTDVPVENAFVP